MNSRCVAVVVACLVATASSANPNVELTIRNADQWRTVEAFDVCIGDWCKRHESTCEPGAECNIRLSLPDGCYRLSVRSVAGGLVGEPSNVVLNPMFHGPVCHDGNGDGRVSGADWRSLWEAFNTGTEP